MHFYYFCIIVTLCVTLILLLQAMITLDNKRNPGWAPRRTTYQPQLFDQDEENDNA